MSTTATAPPSGASDPSDWPGHQGGRIRTTELNAGYVGILDAGDIAAILRHLDALDFPVYVLVDDDDVPAFVDGVIEVRRDDFGGGEKHRAVCLRAHTADKEERTRFENWFGMGSR